MYTNPDNYEVDSVDDTLNNRPAHSRFENEAPVDVVRRPERDPEAAEKPIELSPELALPRIRAYLDVGSSVLLTVTGSSMQPFLADRRDSVVLSPVKRKLKAGDIVFYLRSENMPILHRIVRVDSPKVFICCGDAQNTPELVRRDQILAVVSDIVYRGSYISCSSASWRFKSLLWMKLMPLRPRLLRLIMGLRHWLKRK